MYFCTIIFPFMKKKKKNSLEKVRCHFNLLSVLVITFTDVKTLLMLIASFQGIFIFSWVQFRVLTYNKTYEYPMWAQAIGLCMAFSSMLCIPLCAAVRLMTTPGTLRQVRCDMGGGASGCVWPSHPCCASRCVLRSDS